MDGAALWKSLKGIGTQTVILNLIRDLHTYTTSRVESVTSFSQLSRLPPGRQDCVLGSRPLLPCGRLADVESEVGWQFVIRMGPNTFDDLDYADDGVLLPPDRALVGAVLE